MLSSQSCLTLCNPMGCSPPGSSVLGISQARILEWVAISSCRGSSQLRDRTRSLLHFMHWQRDCLPPSHLGSPLWFTEQLLKSRKVIYDNELNQVTELMTLLYIYLADPCWVCRAICSSRLLDAFLHLLSLLSPMRKKFFKRTFLGEKNDNFRKGSTK